MEESTEKQELQVVLGASGGLGKAIVTELLRKGKPVRAVNRSGKIDLPDQVEVVSCDVKVKSDCIRACANATVIYHCLNLPYTDWVKHLPIIMDGVIESAISAKAKIVFGDNLYMYGPVSGLITPDLPYNAIGAKGKIRAEIATKLMKAHQKGKIRATIGCASDFFGPNVLNSFVGKTVFESALKGKTVNVLGDLDQPHTYTFIEDFAKGLVTLGEREEADGEIWHIPSAETITTREFLNLIFEQIGTKPKVAVASRMLLKFLGIFNPMMREFSEIFYEFEQPYIMDHSKYEKVFGAETTAHNKAIARTLQWFRTNRI